MYMIRRRVGSSVDFFMVHKGSFLHSKTPRQPYIMNWASSPEPIMRVMHLVMQIHHYSSSSTLKS